MLQSRLSLSIRTATSTLSSTLRPSLTSLLTQSTTSTPFPRPSTLASPFTTTQTRSAQHAAQGRANGPKDTAGKRLGAKKSGGEYVVPGNIIFRQRGTKWFPGENCDMGRDHTIFATQAGYVQYYKDEARHPDRQYIGVVFEKEVVLPTPRHAVRRRRLGMLPAPRRIEASEKPLVSGLTLESETTVRGTEAVKRSAVPAQHAHLTLRPGYMFRESNYEIGRAAEKAGIFEREFDRRDRWKAWRVRSRNIKLKVAAKAIKNSRKGGSKKGKPGRAKARK